MIYGSWYRSFSVTYEIPVVVGPHTDLASVVVGVAIWEHPHASHGVHAHPCNDLLLLLNIRMASIL